MKGGIRIRHWGGGMASKEYARERNVWKHGGIKEFGIVGELQEGWLYRMCCRGLIWQVKQELFQE